MKSSFFYDVRKAPLHVAVMRVLRAFKLIPHLSDLNRIFNNQAYQQHTSKACEVDPFFFIAHRLYIARGMTTAHRVKSTLDHYAYETQVFNDAYFDALADKGYTLWRMQNEEASFDLKLEHGNDVLYAGLSSLVFYQNNERICVISFCVQEAGDFISADERQKYQLQADDKILFVTRKQPTFDYSYQKIFNKAFDRTTVAHLCMGALVGYAKAMGIQYAIGVSKLAHPALVAKKDWDEHHQKFEVAYDEFWRSLGGEALAQYGFMLAIPFKLASLDDLDAKARKRAIARRQHAEQIAEQAEQSLKASVK